MNCHYCKKNLTNYEIFFKLDYCFCSHKCRHNFVYPIVYTITPISSISF